MPLPTPCPTIPVICVKCRTAFDAEVDEETNRRFGKVITATVCDDCTEAEIAAHAKRETPTIEQRRRDKWIRMTGSRYAQFRREDLPQVILRHVGYVMNWKPQPKGIGLVGPTRTGKSPLLFALAQNLYVSGADVFPTSGIEFQRLYLRSFDKDTTYEWADYLRECERCAVLLIDDADKLNLTAGVEAEYYGMLEHRRNWQLPVLCTLNLTGEEFAALGRERSDRAAAIVERLRDLCEFIPV